MHARAAFFSILSLSTALAASGTFADVVISTAATQNMTCNAGVCAPTAVDAVLNVTDIENLLLNGSVEITTTGSGVQANDLRLAVPLTWSADSTLTFNAYRSVSVEKALSVTGPGGLSIATNAGGSGGTLSFGSGGHATFANLGSALAINGTSFELVDSISTLAAASKANPAGSYALANDYNASKDGVYRNSPITEFSGFLEGLGNTISHFSVRPGRDGAGAFITTVDASGVVSSFRLDRETLVLKGHNGGAGLVIENFGTLFSDAVDVEFSNNCKCVEAGLVYYNEGSITRSSAKITSSSSVTIGGLAFWNSGNISESQATGSISGVGSYAGGLVTQNLTGATISSSFSDIDITSSDIEAFVGGLVGSDEGDISDSYAMGNVTVGARSAAGGLAGYASGKISASYSTGMVSGGTGSYVGGFIGESGNASCANCYLDTTTSGTGQGTGEGIVVGKIIDLTTEQLQSGLPRGFKKHIWEEREAINDGFPYLIDNPPSK
jgi:hypothetical protein